jgi:hypothetical protein
MKNNTQTLKKDTQAFWVSPWAIGIFGTLLGLYWIATVIFFASAFIYSIEEKNLVIGLSVFNAAILLVFTVIYVCVCFKRVVLTKEGITLYLFKTALRSIAWDEVIEAGMGIAITKSAMHTQLYVINHLRVVRRRYKNRIYINYDKRSKNNIILFGWSKKAERMLAEFSKIQLKY